MSTIKQEIETLRENYTTWEGNKLLQHYHDVLMEVLKCKQNNTLTQELAKEYVSLQQEILRRLDLALS